MPGIWDARLVSRFSDPTIKAIVDAVGYDDPKAAEYLTQTLIERRDTVARVWLNGVNPIVDVTLASDGTLTFANAAITANVAKPPAKYLVSWSRFDNASGVHEAVGDAMESTGPRLSAPAKLLSGTDYVAATVRAEHPDHPRWNDPVQVYFRRMPAGWKTVGIFR